MSSSGHRPKRSIGPCSRSTSRPSRLTTCMIVPSFSTERRVQFQASDRMARENGLAFIPNVMPGYDDTRLRGRDRATLDRQGGSFYRSFWKMASPFVTAEQPFLIITTFNEWHEGTELEPSREYAGFLYQAHERADCEEESGDCIAACQNSSPGFWVQLPPRRPVYRHQECLLAPADRFNRSTRRRNSSR